MVLHIDPDVTSTWADEEVARRWLAAFPGELRAPLTALLATRDARGQYAREELGERIESRPDDHLWHYRLCQRQRTIPLGWTIGDATTAEMREQLTGAEGAADNAGNTLGIVGEF